MQNRTRVFSSLGSSCRRVVNVCALTVFLIVSVCAQTPSQHQECEHLFTAAVRAEQQSDPIEAELRYDECRDLAQKYRFPKMEAAALHRLAVIRAKNRKFTESANLFRKAMGLDPRNAMILSDFGQLYADRKDYGEAEIIFKKALDIAPNNPKVLFNLGSVIASQRGERQIEGLRYLKLAVGEAEAYRELARICHAKGDIAQAEFMEQQAKEKFAKDSTSASYALTAERVPNRSMQPSMQSPKTPPEVVDRVQKEVAASETSKTVAQIASSTLAQSPPKSAPAAPNNPALNNHGKPAAMPQQIAAAPTTVIAPKKEVSKELLPVTPVVPPAEIIAVSQQQLPTNTPVDPFDSIHPIQPPVDPFGQEAPLAAQPLLAAQASPAQPESQQTAPPDQVTNQVKKLETISFAREVENNPTTPPLTKIASSSNTGGSVLQRLPDAMNVNRQQSAQSSQTAPKKEDQLVQSQRDNPLRQIPPGGAGLLDPGSESPTIAALPSYTKVGAKKLDSIDKQNIVPVPSNNSIVDSTTLTVRELANADEKKSQVLAQPQSVSQTLEPVPMTRRTETASNTNSNKEVNVLQSPSAVLARRDLPATKSADSVATADKSTYTANDASNVRPDIAKQTSTVAQESAVQKVPEYARIVMNGQRFNTKTAPAVLKFGAIRNDPPPEMKPEKLVEIAAKSGENEPKERPLMIVKSKSETPKPTREIPADPFPVAAASPVPVLDNPFAMPQVAEVKKIEPQTPALPVAVTVAPVMIPVPENEIAKAKFAEAKIEPRPASLPPVLPAVTAPPRDPFYASNEVGSEVGNEKPQVPKFVEVIKSATSVPLVVQPAESPKLAEVKPVPIQQPLLVKESITKPLPPADTPAGFASTRKKAPKIASEDQTMGYARSRR